MTKESEKEIYIALINAERTIALLNSMVLSAEKHSNQTETLVKESLDKIRNVKYCFMD